MARLEAARLQLVAESDLNRTELLHDLAAWQRHAREAVTPLRRISALVTSAARVAALFSVARRVFRRRVGDERSMLAIFFDTAKAALSLWPMVRANRR
ncbi:MAG: hypothetical protein KGR98_03535 [Verrucomicrobia bacterium]|nr:hypothetical protein [Verrucomicrobiota bacterium]MDE3099677.1 hypothetical protein [Verrucomicrobiota bacterium]